MQYNLSIKQLEELLKTDAYRATNYPCHNLPEFEELSDYGNIKTLFDDLLTQLGRPPSQKEYVTAGTARAKEFFKPNTFGGRASVHTAYKNGKTKQLSFIWNSELITAVQKRLSRTYPSLLVEYSTIIMLKEMYPNFKLAANLYIDGIFGADIVVASKEHNRVFYIHVIRNSASSRQLLKEKATRKGFCQDVFGHNKYFIRNWSTSHTELAYDTHESSRTANINGNFIMKPEYVREVIEGEIHSSAANSDGFNSHSQISIFHTWLIKNKVDSNGLNGSWVQ